MKINEIDVSAKRVILRVDFNVPVSDGKVQDDNRIRMALPTIEYLMGKGAKLIILSHLGRPGKHKDSLGRIPRKKFSLNIVADYLAALVNFPVHFCEDTIGSKAESAVADLKDSEILVLENTRFYDEEQAGDQNFAEELSKLGDVYINDAFGTAHRAHASTAVIAQFFPKEKKAFGFLMEKEIEMADKLLQSGESPKVAILGGAKISDKIGLVSSLIDKVDTILIGGGMAYTFVKSFGGEIGNSLLDEKNLAFASQVFRQAREKNVQILLPQDSIVASELSDDVSTEITESKAIPEGKMGLDIGPKAIEHFNEVILEAKTIIWNGPMGVFEKEAFANGTLSIARAVAKATQENGAFSLIGGGDSAAAIRKMGMEDKVSYISTGGGAMLEYLEGITLPGIAAILEE